MARVTPLLDRLLIRPQITNQKSGRIYIPETARHKTQEAVVLAVGESVRNVTAGDHVIYDKFSGIGVNGGAEVIVKVADILAVLEA